jgi:hypothetical protein
VTPPAVVAAPEPTAGSAAVPEPTDPPADPPADPPTDPAGDPPTDPDELDTAPVSEEVQKALAAVGVQLTELSKETDAGEVQIQLLDLGDSLKQLAEGKVPTEKAGSKMAGKRLGMLLSAVKTLNSLVKELRGAQRAKKSDDAPATPAAPATPNPAPAATPAPKADPEMLAMMKSVQESQAQTAKAIEGLTRVVGKHGTRIETITKNFGGGNQEPFDGDEGAPATEPVSWPLDMNSPPESRESVEKKGTSFYDKN